MKSTVSLAFAAVLAVASAGPVIGNREAYTPPSYGSGYGGYGGPPGYGPPPSYGQSTSLVGTGSSTSTMTSSSSAVASPVAPTLTSASGSPIGGSNTTFPMPTVTSVTSMNSSLGSPIGASNTSGVAMPTLPTTLTTTVTVPYTPSNTSLASPIGASNSSSIGLPSPTGYYTITVTMSPSPALPSASPTGSANVTIPFPTGSTPVSPITASLSTSGGASTGAIPISSNSTSTSRSTSTVFVTLTVQPSDTGTPVIPPGNVSITTLPYPTGTGGGVTISPITGTLNVTRPPYGFPTGYSPYQPSFSSLSTGVSSSVGSPVTAGLNSTTSSPILSTGIASSTGSPVTAGLNSTTSSPILSTGVSSSVGSPITGGLNSTTSSTTSSVDSTTTTTTDVGEATGTTTVYITIYPSETATSGSSEDSPIGASTTDSTSTSSGSSEASPVEATSSAFSLTFSSASRASPSVSSPTTDSSTATSTVTDLETFPSILPESTTSGEDSPVETETSSITTPPVSGTAAPIPFPSTAYGYGGYGAPPAYGVYEA